MTICDRTIPFTKVLMVLPRHTIQTPVPLAEGYQWYPWDPALKEPWARLMLQTGLVESLEEGVAQWEKMEAEDPAMFHDHFFFVSGPDGDLAATAGLFPGHDFPDRLRLHWVATSLDHQHKGLAKAVISRIACDYETMNSRYPLYLSTQSQSHGAIKLYTRLGFIPYMGEYKDHTSEQSQEDWKLVTEVLRNTEQDRR